MTAGNLPAGCCCEGLRPGADYFSVSSMSTPFVDFG